MRLDEDERMNLFEKGRNLDPNLGCLFQNDIDIKLDDVVQEFRAAYQMKEYMIGRFDKYLAELRELSKRR